jgi:hypothetical protein
VEVPLAGWFLGAKETAPFRKGLAVHVEVEVTSAVLEATLEGSTLSKGNVATVGAVIELLRSRPAGSGLA